LSAGLRVAPWGAASFGTETLAAVTDVADDEDDDAADVVEAAEADGAVVELDGDCAAVAFVPFRFVVVEC
jgi:hypothetical protein